MWTGFCWQIIRLYVKADLYLSMQVFLPRFKSNNNLYISVTDRYVWEDNSDETVTDWRTNLDYDGFDWNNNNYAFKWKNERLATLEELQVNYGIELNGKRVKKEEIFNQYDFPASPASAPLQYLTLKEGCNAIDAGIMLNNINENFTGDAPDLGAFEYGVELPLYGPRENNQVNVSNENILIGFELKQNYPNPFNPETVISYRLSVISDVSLKIFDVLGREITTLVNGMQSPGIHTVEWNGKNSAGQQAGSGIYFYRLTAGNGFVETKKMILLK